MWIWKLKLLYMIMEISKRMLTASMPDKSYSACRCYTFLEKRHSMSGIFKSPNHSNYFLSNIPCILYIFKGSPGQIVKLLFQSFQLRSHSDGRCIDYLELYLNLESVELISDSKYDYRFCSNITTQDEFYSKFHILIIKFYFSPVSHSKPFKGFVGKFQFFSKESFRSSGDKIIGSQCSRKFFSPQTNEWSEGKSGRFFSPNYPQNYEPNMQCQFIFKAQQDERIILTFRNIHLDSPNTHCFPGSQYDYILITEDIYQSRKKALAFLCGKFKYVQIVSNGPLVTVSFISNQNNIEKQGFEAMYNYVAKYKVYPTPFINTSLDIEVITKIDYEQSSQPEEYEFYSKSSTSGTVSSPNYPTSYPNDCEIFYIFYGFSDQLVEIRFTKFNLGTIQNCDKPGEDRLEIYDGEFSKILIKTKTPNIIFCGNWNYYYKSTSNFLTLRFISNSKGRDDNNGFSFEYRFVTTTVSTAESFLSKSEDEKEKKCQYIIESNGTTIKSRITQYFENEVVLLKDHLCKWILKGTKNQRIVIKLWNSGVQHDGNSENKYMSKKSQQVNQKILHFPFSCKFAKELKILSYRSDSQASDVHTDISRWCMEDGLYSIMSSNIPRMDIIMHFRGLKASSDRYNEAFHVEYSFVEDFGVISNGVQKNSTCYFDFESSKFQFGNFSSPNFPGYIPSNIVCVYVFRGSRGNQIQIFLSDREPTKYHSLKCSDNVGNVLKFDSCSLKPFEISQIIFRQNEIRKISPIIWSDNCLKISLISKGSCMYKGFMGSYRFIKTDHPNLATAKNTFATANSLIILMTITFLMIIH